jgi:hypothetical protein
VDRVRQLEPACAAGLQLGQQRLGLGGDRLDPAVGREHDHGGRLGWARIVDRGEQQRRAQPVRDVIAERADELGLGAGEVRFALATPQHAPPVERPRAARR